MLKCCVNLNQNNKKMMIQGFGLRVYSHRAKAEAKPKKIKEKLTKTIFAFAFTFAKV